MRFFFASALIGIFFLGTLVYADTTSISQVVDGNAETDQLVEMDKEIYESLGRYEFRDPKNDLKEAISRNDYRFMFVCGYACEAPGVENYHDKYSQQYAYVTIDDTGDYILSDEHRRLKAIVQAYAEKYNKLLIEEIKKKEEG